ncbi:hypothetical protein D920_02712 [Enterococcus faecalis 13-SD-W-01]|nr:hypothetical protein D920_02712 [Enterococcus faecalis 13-SD-W-01]
MTISIRKPAAEDAEKIQGLAKECGKHFSIKHFLRELQEEEKSLIIAESEKSEAHGKIVAFGLAEVMRGKDFTFESPKYELIQTSFFSIEDYAQEAEKRFVGYWLAEAKKRKINQFFVELIDEEEKE